MPSPIVPKALEPGQTIAWISPSLRLNDKFPNLMTRATAILKSKGYKVREFYTVDKGGIQDSIANRLSELRAAFTDPTINAVFCTIGGTTFTELLPALLADTALHEAIRAHPKVVVGYSDITGLHWFLHAVTGLRTFYGPGAISDLGELVASPEDEDSPVAFSARNLFRAVANRAPIGDLERSRFFAPTLPPTAFDDGSTEVNQVLPSAGWIWLRPGRGEGRLFGGCLTVMARIAGVRAIAPDWRGRIVFLETATGEGDLTGPIIERVQAGIADLIAQGVFDDVAGLVVGRPFGYHTPEKREEYANVIKGLLCEGPMAEKKFPILYNVDFGHSAPILTLPYDTLARLDSDNDQFAILESAVI